MFRRLTRLWARLRITLERLGELVRKERVEEELDAEVRFHIDREADRLRERGHDPAEARRLARMRFGGTERIKEEVRDARGTRWIANAVFDLRRALRRLRRDPGLTLPVVAVLALGIGANATMFGILDRVLLSPPPHIQEPEGIRRVEVGRSFLGSYRTWSWLTWPDVVDLQAAETLAAVAAYSESATMSLGRGDDVERVGACYVSGAFFPLLGTVPAHGRLLGPDDDRVGATRVAVLGHTLWQHRYGGDPDVVGRRIDLGHGDYTVVGVAPEGFNGVDLEPVDVWLPLRTVAPGVAGTRWMENRGQYWLHAVARLDPTTGVEAAADEATALHRSGRRQLIEEGRYSEDAEVVLEPLIVARGSEVPRETRIALWLAGVSAIVLVIACANVANLLLARASRHRAEIGLRLALGAPRRRVVGQQVLQSVLLALLGGVAAGIAAWWMGDLVRGVLMPDVAWTDPGLALRVALFAAAAAIVSGIAAGLLPGVRAVRQDLVEALQGGTRSVAVGRSRLQSWLTVGQIALSSVLLVGAGLFVRSLERVHDLDLGFDAHRVLVAAPDLDETDLPDDEREMLFAAVAERVGNLGGVADVSVATDAPFHSSYATALSVPGRDELPETTTGGPYVHGVEPGYFSTLGIRLLEGRVFTPEDRADGRLVAVVNRTMSRLMWPGQDPLGRCLKIGGDEAPCSTVVGVVEDSRRTDLVEDETMQYYYPLAQGQGGWLRSNILLVRLESAATDVGERVASAVSREFRELAPELRYVRVEPLWGFAAHEARPWELGATLFSAFGLLAVLVAAAGLAGVLAFDVARRTREIGVRSALGASRGGIVRLVIRDAMRLALPGLVVGLGAAWLLARWMESLLFRVSPADPLVYGAVVVFLVLVAAAASALPAWNAARIDPNLALKAE